MSINVGQLFVRHDNLNLILRVAAEYVRVWQQGIFSRLSNLEKQEQGAENFLTRRSRRVNILPPKDGWAMIIEQVRFLADGDMARHLSEGLDCRVIWAEVQGGALGWACFEFDKGQLVKGKLEPRSGREERLVAAANEAKAINLSEAQDPEMPVYPTDPERAAWDHLCGLGLPREYIFVYPGDVVRLNSGGEMEAGFLTLRDSHYGGRLIATVGPAKFLPRPAGLPYRPDLVAREGGEPTTVHEVRLLHGRPSSRALDSAFAAELAWRRRAFSVMSATLTGKVPQVIFRYKDPADPDRDIDAAMEKRREACSSPLIGLTSGSGILARKAFAARAAEALNAAESGLEAAPDDAGNLTAKVDGESVVLDLAAAYRRYLSEPPALEAAASEALEGFRIRAELAKKLTPSDGEELILVVRQADALPADAVSTPIAEDLAAVLAVERDDRLVEVPDKALTALKLDKDAALEKARTRLAALAADAAPTPGLGSFGRLEKGAPLPAASLLAWPGLAGWLSDLFEGETVAAAPAANVLLYAPASAANDPEFRAAIAGEFDSAAEPVSNRVFKLTESGPVPA